MVQEGLKTAYQNVVLKFYPWAENPTGSDLNFIFLGNGNHKISILYFGRKISCSLSNQRRCRLPLRDSLENALIFLNNNLLFSNNIP